MVGVVTEIATNPQYEVNLKLHDVVTIELPKLDFKARPGAQGDYHEAILLLDK